MRKEINKILDLKLTCSACPTQLEGFIQTPKGRRPLYIRYRWGYLSIRVGDLNSDDIMTAVMGREVIGEQIGNCLDGILDESVLSEYLTKLQLTDIESEGGK